MHITFYHNNNDLFSFDCDVLPQVGNIFYHTTENVPKNKRKTKVYEVIEIYFIAKQIERDNGTQKSLWVEVHLNEATNE